MRGTFVLALPAITIGFLLFAVLILVPRRRRLVTLDAHAFPALARLRNVTLICRVAGILVGIAAIVALNNVERHGLGVLLVFAVFGASQILATLVAGIITHNSARTPGTAGLEVRHIRSYLPPKLTALTLSATALLAIVLSWTTAVASPDDRGYPSRAFSYAYACEYSLCGRGFGPFPGSYYSAPLTLALLLTLLIAAVAIVVTVRRPRNSSDPEILRVDDIIRSRSVESILAAVGIAMAGSLFAVTFLIGSQLGLTINDVPTGLRVLGIGAVLMSTAAFVMTVWCIVVLLLPGARAARNEANRIAAANSAGAL